MRRTYQVLFFLHLIVGVSAMGWGIWLMISPSNPLLGMSMELLDQIELNNFFLSAIFLFMGIGNLFSSIRLVFNFLPGLVISYRFQGLISTFLSLALIYLLYKRYRLINEVDLFTILFSLIGIIKLGISLIMTIHIFLFPVRLLSKVLKNPEYFK